MNSCPDRGIKDEFFDSGRRFCEVARCCAAIRRPAPTQSSALEAHVVPVLLNSRSRCRQLNSYSVELCLLQQGPSSLGPPRSACVAPAPVSERADNLV